MGRVMVLIDILKNLKKLIRLLIDLRKTRKKFPTCQIYNSTIIDSNSVLGGYNLICENVIAINSYIGEHTIVQKNTTIFNSEIGKFCGIAARCSVGQGRHQTTFVSSHPAFHSNQEILVKSFHEESDKVISKRTCIGHDTYIGENAMIMDGIKVGIGAVIGMGAVVIEDVPDYAIVFGNPARIYKYRFEKEIIKKLLETKWWDMPVEFFEKNGKCFNNPETFFKCLDL
ncbi:MAG: antibiotic acetyltransferase [PVC group bacterium]|nr:antibiotic acetyltransferase [PVC group bacterium]